MTRRASHAIAALAAVGLVVTVTPGDAHKPITSPYSYNDDVFPILRERCGRCHVSGGVLSRLVAISTEFFALDGLRLNASQMTSEMSEVPNPDFGGL